MKKISKMNTGEWLIFLILCFFVTISCETPPPQEDIYYELERVEAKAFATFDGSQDYIQTIYLDTLNEFTRTKIYAESTDMAPHQKYNGESNIRASFSTTTYWSYSDGNLSEYPVYYVYPFSVRFIPPADRYEYQPTELALFTQQNIGPIPKAAIIKRERFKIYMDVSYDGEYHVKDSILVELRPR